MKIITFNKRLGIKIMKRCTLNRKEKMINWSWMSSSLSQRLKIMKKKEPIWFKIMKLLSKKWTI